MVELKWIEIILLGMVCLSTKAIDKSDVGNANDYVDATLRNLRKDRELSKHINPLKVQDIHQDYYTITNLKIWGLISLYRHGNCSLTYNGETVNFVAEIAVKNVSITSDYSAKALFFWIHGDGEIEVDHLAVKLDFSSTIETVCLNSFKVVDLGDYKIRRMTGITFVFNWLLKIIANVIAQFCRQKIIKALEIKAGKALGDLLKQYKIPIL